MLSTVSYSMSIPVVRKALREVRVLPQKDELATHSLITRLLDSRYRG